MPNFLPRKFRIPPLNLFPPGGVVIKYGCLHWQLFSKRPYYEKVSIAYILRLTSVNN